MKYFTIFEFFLLAVLVKGQVDLGDFQTKFDIEHSNEGGDWIDDAEVELPFSVCKRNDPDRDECIKNTIEKILPSIGNGYAKLGIAPMDPYSVKRASFDYKNTNFYGNLNVRNAKTYGLSKGQVKLVRSEVTDDSMNIEVDAYFPRLVMEGTYKGDGHFNDYLVKSKGIFNVTQKDVYITMIMKGKVVSRNDEKYMEIQEFDFQQPVVGNMKIFATGIHPEPIVNQLVLDFMNNYWPFVYAQLVPQTKSSWEPIMIRSINLIFNRIPFRRLMPED